ncbi:MAG TPA: hypothetical protein VN633_07275 [Bryobacteraceae bacterium]|nr:hypothetical protein [Bryobacteraceae bacterium]
MTTDNTAMTETSMALAASLRGSTPGMKWDSGRQQSATAVQLPLILVALL